MFVGPEPRSTWAGCMLSMSHQSMNDPVASEKVLRAKWVVRTTAFLLTEIAIYIYLGEAVASERRLQRSGVLAA